MKHLFLLLFFSAGIGLATTVQAQSCCASKKATAAVSHEGKSATALAAVTSGTIETRVDANTGAVTYVRRDVCQESGKTTYKTVAYDAELGTFVETPTEVVAVADRAAEAGEALPSGACCADKEKTACADKKSSNAASEKNNKPKPKSASVKLVRY